MHAPVPGAASGNGRPAYDLAQALAASVVAAPDDVPADHAGLLLVGGMAGTLEREVAQRRGFTGGWSC